MGKPVPVWALCSIVKLPKDVTKNVEVGGSEVSAHIPLQCLHQIDQLLHVRHLSGELIKIPYKFRTCRKLKKEPYFPGMPVGGDEISGKHKTFVSLHSSSMHT